MKLFDPKLTGSIEIQDQIKSNVDISGSLDIKNNLTVTGSITLPELLEGTGDIITVSEGVLGKRTAAQLLEDIQAQPSGSYALESQLHDAVTLGENQNGLSLTGQQLSLALASTSTTGALSATDWNTFNGKQNNLGYTPENVANKGQINGYASLDGSGKVPAGQLPSYVDDVLEFANLGSFPGTGETGKIYVALDSNKTYRWSGSAYIEVSPSDVNSVFGRTGVVTAQAGDYASFYVRHDINNQGLNATQQLNARTNIEAELAFTKNTAFNKNFGTTAGTVAQGNDNRITNGQTAFGWGNHADAGYVLKAGDTLANTYNFTGQFLGLSLSDLNNVVATNNGFRFFRGGFQSTNRIPGSNWTMGVEMNATTDTGSRFAAQLAVNSERTANILRIRHIVDSANNWSNWFTLWNSGNLPNPIQGTISTGQVAFGTGTGVIGGDSGLVWDNVDKRLGLQNSSITNNTNQIILKLSSTRPNDRFSGIGVDRSIDANRIGLSFYTSEVDVTAALRWSILFNGILQSNGAQTIQTSTGNLTLATGGGNGNILLTPNGSGNVGIGTTAPWARLSIPFNNSLSFGSESFPFSITRSSAGNLVTTFADSYNDATTRIDFVMRNGSANQNTALSISGSGNVGIGTSSPSAKLSFGISDVIAEIGRIGFDVASNQRAYIAANRHTAGGQLTDLSFGTMATERMRITSDGNVGIGTSAPTNRLHIFGTFSQAPAMLIQQNTTIAGSAIIRMNSAGAGGNVAGLDLGGNVRVFRDAAFFNQLTIGPDFTVANAKMVVDVITGNVGIGNTANLAGGGRLQVSGKITASGSGNLLQLNGGSTGNANSNWIGFFESNGTVRQGYFGFGSTGSSGLQLVNDTSTGSIEFYTQVTERMRINSGGNILIGTTSETAFSGTNGIIVQRPNAAISLSSGASATASWLMYRVDSNADLRWYNGSDRMLLSSLGTLTVTGDVVAFSSSDIRLKNNITTIENPLEKILKLGGYSFDWNEKQDTYTGKDYGIIAQEVEALFPEMVTTRDSGMKAVKYDRLIPVLIEAVKELSNKVKILEEK
jgi:hypothetical protein